MANEEAHSEPERYVSPVLVIFVLAFAVRAVYLLQSLGTPYFGAPFLDEQYFYEWAARISSGQLGLDHAFFRAPFYPYVLGGLFALFGPNFFLPKLVQHVLGSAAAVLVFKVGERCFDRRTGWVAGLMAALYPPMIFFEGEMLDISLQCFFYPLLILIGLHSLRDPRWRWTVLFGVTAGAAAIARPNVLLLILCWLVLQVVDGERWGGRGRGLARAAAIVGLVALWTIPPLVHNVRADGSWVPISTYAGINFYIGNSPSADGYTASTPHRVEVFGEYRDSVELFARYQAELKENRTLSGAEVQRYWLGLAWRTVAASPGRFVTLLTRKLVLFWNGEEIRNNKDLNFALAFTPALKWIHSVWNFRVLAPLGLLGLAIAAVRRRSVETLWLGLGVGAHMVSVVLFFVCDRYRLPVAPMLIVFAALALTALWQWGTERDAKRLGAAVLGLAAAAVFVNVHWFDTTPAVPHKDLWNVANCCKRKGQLDEAIRWYQEFIEKNPDFADGWNNLGEVYVRLARQDRPVDLDRIRRALGCFERAMKCDSRLSMPWNNAGYCHLDLDDPTAALAAFDRAIALAAANRPARNGRAEALAALNRTDEALAELDRLLADDPDYVLALWTKAAILARRGDRPQALELARRAIVLAEQAGSTSIADRIRTDPALAELLSPGNE